MLKHEITMCAQPAIYESETDVNKHGDPVELDLLLASNMPLASDNPNQGDDDAPMSFSRDDIEPDVLEDLANAEFEEAEPVEQAVVSAPAKRGRPKAPAPEFPAAVGENGQGLTVYQRLIDYGLLRKMTDIVLAKVAMPWHLRADAAQEVHVYWATLKVKPEYQRDQLGCYAYLSGKSAALKLRRTIGAVVTIPGALFRTGRESAFMEAIGAAVNPKDVEDYKDSLELSTDPADDLHLSRVSDDLFANRLGDLNLSAKQTQVARKALIERKAADDIAEELGMDLMYVERLLNQVTAKLMAKDDGVVPAKPVRKPRKVATGPKDEPTSIRVKAVRVASEKTAVNEKRVRRITRVKKVVEA